MHATSYCNSPSSWLTLVSAAVATALFCGTHVSISSSGPSKILSKHHATHKRSTTWRGNLPGSEFIPHGNIRIDCTAPPFATALALTFPARMTRPDAKSLSEDLSPWLPIWQGADYATTKSQVMAPFHLGQPGTDNRWLLTQAHIDWRGIKSHVVSTNL